MNVFAPPKPLSWLSVDFDRSLAVDDAKRLVVSLLAASSLRTVVFEVEYRNKVCVYRVGSTQPDRARTLLEVFVPGVTVQRVVRQIDERGSAWTVRSNTRRRTLDVDQHEAITHRLLGALAVDGAIHQVVIGRRLRPTSVPTEASGFQAENMLSVITEAVWSGSRRFDSELRRAMADKQAEPGADVWMRLLVPGDRKRSVGAVSNYSAALRSVESPGVRLRLQRENWGIARSAKPGWIRRLSLNASELTGVLGWPYGDRTYKGIDRTGSRLLPTATGDADRILGRGAHPASKTKVGLSAKDGLRHLWAMGPTGVGKSTLLENLALQDIAAGRGVVVIDPKGDLVEGILSRARPTDLDRIVVLDAARTDHVVGFNPLAVPASDAELAVDGVLHVMRSLNADSWGPRTQDILHAGLLTLTRSDKATLVALPQLLLDERFRRNIVGSHLSPALRSFWTWYEDLSTGERSNVIAPVLNKIRPFTMRTSLRAMLGQTRPAFDMNTVFTERKVLLVPLRKGQIGSETANLLGSMIMARLWQLTQGRASIPAERRHEVFAYLDEFQEYLRLPTDFSEVLTQSRGLGLGLVLAHQHLKQLNGVVKAAVSANAQSSVMFRLGDGDANEIARPVRDLDATDFASLPAYSAYCKVLVDGEQCGYGSITTLPPRTPVRSAKRVADKLAQRWGADPAVVDAQLYGTSNDDEASDAPIGIKKRSQS